MRKALYILADLDDLDLLWLVENGDYHKFPAGTRLIQSGVDVVYLYIVIDGTLDVIFPPSKKIGEMGPGDIIGEISLIEKRPPAVSVVTARDSKLLAIPQQCVRDRLREDIAFASRFYHALAVFLADRLRARVATLSYGDAKAKDVQAGLEQANELDENVLDSLHVAGDRMRRLFRLLEGGEPTR
ncbi:cyclic nucleotide-binding domain-containing protein [Lamprobacter modestohalophilus]|uniref:cyclic nucleotide-binding domain-containing protein n=1 Tax=Lamprobacter modestohalophilus TaxID=1064514 RepID=UPI002ADEDFCC|nr:cyclic nucleotide-binding domain-containing protein [Lamprobacter modestohalophilus]MEA1051735.1 cyclic nucleotide-binding domain-containing protein [Lamprobacter modestohalophilus]